MSKRFKTKVAVMKDGADMALHRAGNQIRCVNGADVVVAGDSGSTHKAPIYHKKPGEAVRSLLERKRVETCT